MLQALLVANVSEHIIEDRELGTLVGRDVKPGWAMTASRPTVFRATVLPPVFGPVTTSIRKREAEIHVDRGDDFRPGTAGTVGGAAGKEASDRLVRHLVQPHRSPPAPARRGRPRAAMA